MNIEKQLNSTLGLENIGYFQNKEEKTSENSTAEEEARGLIEGIESELTGLENIAKKFIFITEDENLTPAIQGNVFTSIKNIGENVIFQLSDLYKKMTGLFLSSGTIKLLDSLQGELDRAQFNIPNEIEFSIIGIMFTIKTVKSTYGKFAQSGVETNKA